MCVAKFRVGQEFRRLQFAIPSITVFGSKAEFYYFLSNHCVVHKFSAIFTRLEIQLSWFEMNSNSHLASALVAILPR